MSDGGRSALVLQGGGALGAYELGAARRLYRDDGFRPDVVAGVSIGAITAVLLSRPAKGLTPLGALEEFWRRVTVSGWFLPPPFRPYASVLGNPNFFVPRIDYFSLARWTNIYDTRPLRHTLAQLVDVEALANTGAWPGLLVTATNVEAGQIEYFYSRRQALTLDHVIASGSLPPSFAMTEIAGQSYWDGGLFDNTPLGAVIDALGDAPDVDRTIYVVNLFPNKAPIPRSMTEVTERTLNLQFANKTAEDLKLMKRFNEVAALADAIDRLHDDNPIKSDPAFQTIKARRYVHVPRIVSVTRPEQVGGFDGSDFSPDTIQKRADEGYAQADKALGAS